MHRYSFTVLNFNGDNFFQITDNFDENKFKLFLNINWINAGFLLYIYLNSEIIYNRFNDFFKKQAKIREPIAKKQQNGLLGRKCSELKVQIEAGSSHKIKKF